MRDSFVVLNPPPAASAGTLWASLNSDNTDKIKITTLTHLDNLFHVDNKNIGDQRPQKTGRTSKSQMSSTDQKTKK